MSFLINGLLRVYGSTAGLSFDKAAKDPQRTQTKLLLNNLVRENAKSVFGKAHGFSGIKSEADYRRQVPIRQFEEFRPYINSLLSGKKSVLTVANPVRFNVTSGTTGEPKYIPVTYENLCKELNLIGQWYYKALLDHPNYLDHHRLMIVSPLNEGTTASGVPFGSASGMVYSQIPKFIRQLYALPEEVFQIKDYETRYFFIARCALAQKISFLLTPNPSTLMRLADVMADHASELIRVIHDGKAGRDLSDQGDPVRSLSHTFKPQPDRARYLEEILRRTGSLRARDVWPELKLIACWLGGSVGMQTRKLAGAYGDLPIRDFGYIASEAHITVPYADHTPSGVLAVQTNYYEFIPEEEHGTKNSSILSCHELEQGKRYAILLTTSSGFYRYDINDIVEVTGYYHKTPLLAFVRKGRDITNITGEKMHANHFLAAMGQACWEFSLSVEQFRAVPDFENSRYKIQIELNADIPEDVLRDQVIPLIDKSLAKENIEYSEKRKSGRLKKPCLVLMKKGWAEAECRNFMQTGKKDVQFKWWSALCAESSPEAVRFALKIVEGGRE